MDYTLILLIIQIIIAVLLIGCVLMQRSENDGFGLGSSGGGGLMSGRGQANFMTKLTSMLAIAFMANSLLLSAITARSTQSSIIEEIAEEEPFSAPRDGDARAVPATSDTPQDIPSQEMAPAVDATPLTAPISE